MMESVIRYKQNRLFVVTGMHRSGTSAITRGLQVLGVPLGDNLYPAGFDNSKGFWEDMDTLNLNIKLLGTLGAAYDSLGLIKKINLKDDAINRLFQQAVALVNEKFERNNGIWGFKDPRTSRLLSFWKEVFSQCNCEVSYVIVIRNPESVAESLLLRNNFEVEKSYLLWLSHTIQSLSDTTFSKRIFVDYDCLMSDAGKELQRIAEAFQLVINHRELELFTNEFLMQELQHSKYHLADTLCNESVPVMVREVYQFLTGYAETTDSNDSDIRKKTEKWMRELLLLEPALELADNLFNRLSANHAMLDEPLPSSGDTSQPLPSIPENDPLQIGGIHHKQVSSIHYQGISYHKKGRFCSYWHQIDEVFNQEPQNVLEIGTGNGFVSDFLIKNGFDLSTLDIDPDLNPTVVGTVLDIPFPDNNFDLVLCCQVLEHLPYESFIPALMQLNRVTRKSVILSLPDMQKVSTIHFQNTKTRFTVFYRHLFSKPIDWKFDGQHYWNIGNKNYPLKRIMDDILTTNFGITRHFRVPENPGHHFFILKK